MSLPRLWRLRDGPTWSTERSMRRSWLLATTRRMIFSSSTTASCMRSLASRDWRMAVFPRTVLRACSLKAMLGGMRSGDCASHRLSLACFRRVRNRFHLHTMKCMGWLAARAPPIVRWSLGIVWPERNGQRLPGCRSSISRRASGGSLPLGRWRSLGLGPLHSLRCGECWLNVLTRSGGSLRLVSRRSSLCKRRSLGSIWWPLLLPVQLAAPGG